MSGQTIAPRVRSCRIGGISQEERKSYLRLRRWTTSNGCQGSTGAFEEGVEYEKKRHVFRCFQGQNYAPELAWYGQLLITKASPVPLTILGKLPFEGEPLPLSPPDERGSIRNIHSHLGSWFRRHLNRPIARNCHISSGRNITKTGRLGNEFNVRNLKPAILRFDTVEKASELHSMDREPSLICQREDGSHRIPVIKRKGRHHGDSRKVAEQSGKGS